MAAANPLRAAIHDAVRANRSYEALFGQIGNTAHPRGAILTAYRNHLVALKQAQGPGDVRSVMSGLRNQVENEARQILMTGAEIGQASAQAQLKAYAAQIKVKLPAALPPALNIENAMSVISQALAQQEEAAMALAMGAGSLALATGDARRQGIVRPGPVTQLLTFWSVAIGGAAFVQMVQAASTAFQKQAIAALDNRTTDCCLQVHGQTVGLEKDFHLTGEPRFADYLDWSPFHWNCRTSVALYRPEFDDGLTEKMRAGADYVLKERAAGRTPNQWPADAFFGGNND